MHEMALVCLLDRSGRIGLYEHTIILTSQSMSYSDFCSSVFSFRSRSLGFVARRKGVVWQTFHVSFQLNASITAPLLLLGSSHTVPLELRVGHRASHGFLGRWLTDCAHLVLEKLSTLFRLIGLLVLRCKRHFQYHPQCTLSIQRHNSVHRHTFLI